MARGEAQEGGNFPGTGWGERRSDPVRRVRVQPRAVGDRPLEVPLRVRLGLRAMGIIPVSGPWRERLANRDSEVGFAKSPRW
jgi:hypothetical protein